MLIKVKVFPNSKKKEIIKKSKDRFEVKIKEKPERNIANKSVIDALSFYFKVQRYKIKIVKGFKERNKIFEIK